MEASNIGAIQPVTNFYLTSSWWIFSICHFPANQSSYNMKPRLNDGWWDSRHQLTRVELCELYYWGHTGTFCFLDCLSVYLYHGVKKVDLYELVANRTCASLSGCSHPSFWCVWMFSIFDTTVGIWIDTTVSQMVGLSFTIYHSFNTCLDR